MPRRSSLISMLVFPEAADPVDLESSRPDFAVLVYALISMKEGLSHRESKQNLLGPDPDLVLVESVCNETQVKPQTPLTVLVHSVDDFVVPVEHSRLMYAALQKAGVPSALQEYSHGRPWLRFRGPARSQSTRLA